MLKREIKTHRIKEKSIFFAPMEGVTCETYRMVINKIFPNWDYMASDFLRIPSQGQYPDKKIISHYGPSVFKEKDLRKKNYLQILTSDHSLTKESAKQISRLGFDWLDLNLGCPSKAVNGSKGGSYLLKDTTALKNILKDIRENFPGFFTAKIRIGYDSDKKFLDIIKLLEDQGVEAITIHGRTKEQMYKGRANWDYIKKAVHHCKIPIIGNGDIWTLEDIENIFQETNCYGIMLGRAALKTPWMAELFHDYKENLVGISLDKKFLLEYRQEKTHTYFTELYKAYKKANMVDEKIHRRFKGLSRYIFDDFKNSEEMKTKIFRSKSIKEFFNYVEELTLN